MYSLESKRTVKKTDVTTQHMTAVNESRRKPQPTFNASELIQGASFK